MFKRMQSAAFAVGLLAAGLFAASSAQAARHYRPLGEEAAANHYTNSLDCLTPAARSLIDGIQAHFGAMQILSTCRPGARVAGSGELSRHSSGNAIDFFAGSRKGTVLSWLIANHTNGGTMTYTTSDHIHVDIGPRWVILAGRHVYPNTQTASYEPARHAKSVRYVKTVQYTKLTHQVGFVRYAKHVRKHVNVDNGDGGDNGDNG